MKKYSDKELTLLQDFVDFVENEMGWLIINNLTSSVKNYLNPQPKRNEKQSINIHIDYKRISDNKISSDIKQFLESYNSKNKGGVGSGGNVVG
jgi:hypothetical protein